MSQRFIHVAFFLLLLTIAACGGGAERFSVPDNSNNSNSDNADDQGNETEVETTPVTPAELIPETTITAGPVSQNSSTSATFTFSANAQDASFECSLDGAGFSPCISPRTVNGLSAGSHTFEVRATSVDGQTDPTPAAYSWQIAAQTPPPDTQAPETVIGSGPDAQTTATSATFTFSANEASTFRCSLDGAAFATCASPRAYTGLAVGNHSFSVRAIDTAGNADASPAAYNWQIITPPPPPDTQAPQTTISSGPSGQTTNTSATFTFTANEAGTFQCRLDGAAFATCASPRAYTGLAVGTHLFEVRAIDAAGNADATPDSRSWEIIPPPDTIAPDTAITSGPADPTNADFADFTFSSTEAGTFQCRLDGAAFASCSSPESLDSLNNGVHVFQVRAVDVAGNTDPSPASYTWEITPPPPAPDTQPPQTSISSGPANPTTATSASFVFAADEPSSFECSLDGAMFSPCSSPANHSSLAVGNHSFSVRATDGSGNTDASPAGFNWRIDASFGLTQRVPFAGSNFPSGLADPAPLTISDAFPGLSFPNAAGQAFYQPLHLVEAPDGTNRLFIVFKDGRIRYFTDTAGVNTSSAFLDLSASNTYSPNQVVTTGESGLLGMAFDPNFATNRYYYVNYVTETGGTIRSVISRFQASADRLSTLAGSETILLQTTHATGYWHKAGTVAFGPDNMLYIAIGDGQVAGNAQTLSNLRGKILRIDPSQPSGGRNYSIPNDNPFTNNTAYPTGTSCPSADGAANSICEEIWAYGFRNPWRMSFDRNNGNLWVGDVGQSSWEEVDLVVRGSNYGWPRYEGNAVTPNNPLNATGPYVAPVFTYPRSGADVSGITVIGGVVYRGSRIPSLYGKYVFLDLGTRRVWAFTYTGSSVTQTDVTTLVTTGITAQPVAIAEDLEGEIYIIQLAGAAPSANVEMYRLAEAPGNPPAPAIPQTLSQTGLFSDTANLTPAAGMIEYDVNSPLWSDWAVKRRWIALPGTSQITFAPTGAWTFPAGTILVKHFELALSATQTKRLETRILINDVSGWQGYTYKWNDAQTDADLLPGSASETLAVASNAPGGARTQTWNYPSRGQCLICHTSALGTVLGPRTHQLNGNFAYPSMTDNQLRSWNNIGLFTADIGEADQYAALSDINDASASLNERAKSYFASNCVQCHNPGPAPVGIDLRYETAIGQMNIRNVAPQAGDLGLSNARIVNPGAKESSVLWERMRRLDSHRMPPLGTNIVDQSAVDAIGQWIDAGAP